MKCENVIPNQWQWFFMRENSELFSVFDGNIMFFNDENGECQLECRYINLHTHTPEQREKLIEGFEKVKEIWIKFKQH